jgi:hypothetical protein
MFIIYLTPDVLRLLRLRAGRRGVRPFVGTRIESGKASLDLKR